MPILVQLPNGKIAEFPDGMTPEQIQQALRQADQRMLVDERGAVRAGADIGVDFAAGVAGFVPTVIDAAKVDEVPEAVTAAGRTRQLIGDTAGDIVDGVMSATPIGDIEKRAIRTAEMAGGGLEGAGNAAKGIADYVRAGAEGFRATGSEGLAALTGAGASLIGAAGAGLRSVGEFIGGDIADARAAENARRVAEGRKTLEEESANQLTSRAAAAVSGAIDDASASLKSDYANAISAEMAKAIEGGVGSTAEFIASSPGEALSAVLGGSAAYLLPGLGAARLAKLGGAGVAGATTAAVQGTGALITAQGAEGARDLVMGMTEEQLAEVPEYAAERDRGLSHEQAQLALAARAYDAAAGAGAVLNAATGAAAQRLGLVPVEQLLARGGRMPAVGRLQAAATGAVREAPGEALQGAGEALAQNLGGVAAGTIEGRDAFDGVGANALLEAAAGSAMGGAVGLASPQAVAEERASLPADLLNPAGQGQQDMQEMVEAARRTREVYRQAQAGELGDADAQPPEQRQLIGAAQTQQEGAQDAPAAAATQAEPEAAAPGADPLDALLPAPVIRAGATAEDQAAFEQFQRQQAQQNPPASPSAPMAERPLDDGAVTPGGRYRPPPPATAPRNLTREDLQGELPPAQTGYAQGVPRLKAGEDSKPYLKRNIDTLPDPTPEQLPSDSALRYFSPKAADAVVPMSALRATKVEEPGNAAMKRMAATAAGVIAKRDAIDVRDNGDGTYTIVDGNGSYNAALKVGLKDMPVRIVEAPAGKEPWRQNRGMLSPEQDEKLLGMYEQAARELPTYDKVLKSIASQFKGKPLVAPLKGRTRAEEKIAIDYGGDASQIKDLLRGSLIFDTPQQAIDAANQIRSRLEVVKDKDHLSPGTPDKGGGYRDINFVVRMPGGTLAEIQVMTAAMKSAKDAGHKHYEIARSVEKAVADGVATPEELADYTAAIEAMKKIYAEAATFDSAATMREREVGDQESGLRQSRAATPETGTALPAGVNLTPEAGGLSPSTTNANTSESLRSENTTPSPSGGMATPSNTSATGQPSSSDAAIVPDGPVDRVIAKVVEALGLSPGVVTVVDLPADLPRGLRRGLDSRTEGIYDPDTGKVYLFRNALPSPSRAVWVAMHELSGHKGLRALLKPEDFAKTLDRAATNPLVQGIARAIEAEARAEAGADGARQIDPALMLEEAIAELSAAYMTGDMDALFARYGDGIANVRAEMDAQREAMGFMRRLIADIKRMLFNAGAPMSDAEVVALIRGANRALRSGAAPQTTTVGSMQSRSAVDESISYDVGPTGAVAVSGDAARIREILESRGITDKGIARGGVLTFTPNQSPRVINALRGETNAASRAGAIYDHVIKNGVIVGAPPKYNTEDKLEQLRAQLRSLATEAGDGRFWYERSGQEVLRMVGGDKAEARKFMQLLAIYSPQADIAPNYVFALRAWMQIKAGSQDRKAGAVVRDGKPWDGEKTNNFYINLMREVDPENYGPEKMGVTSDMWMARAFEYPTDAPNDSQYRFIEIETNRLARELGWEPQQAQAAIWVALKTRMNGDREANRRIDQESIDAGDLVIEDGQRRFNGKDGEQNHRDRWIADALKRDISRQQMSFGEFNYADAISEYLGQVSWEARPGRSTGDRMDWINDAPYEVQAEYQAVVESALRGDRGEDMLAAHLGLPIVDYVGAPGVWQGEVAAGGQSIISLPLRKKPKDYAKDLADREAAGEQITDFDRNMVDPDAQRMVTAYAAIMGRLLKQEGVGWHRPDYASSKRDANGVSLVVGRTLSPEETLAVSAAIEARVGAETAQAMPIVSAPDGVRVLNFSGMRNQDFHARIREAATSALAEDVEIDMQLFRADGALIENDWRVDTNGEGYQRAAAQAGFGPASDWADRVLAPRIDSAQREFAARYGRSFQSRDAADGQPRVRRDGAPGGGGGSLQSRSFPEDAPAFRQRKQQADAVSAQGIHYSGVAGLTSLDGRFAGAGSAGAERRRFGTGQYGERAAPGDTGRRLYFYAQEGDTPPRKEDVVAGNNRYAVLLQNLYDYEADPRGLREEAGANMDYLEELVNDAGFDGMLLPPLAGIEGKIAILHGLKKKVPVVSAPMQSRAPQRPVPGQPTPLYVDRPVIDDGGLRQWAIDAGLTDALPPEEMHVTVTYSRASVDVGDAPAASGSVVARTAGRPVQLNSALAMPLRSIELQRGHRRYRDAGASHDYGDSYTPHVTLKYEPTPEEVAKLKAAPPFTGTVTLGPERQDILRPGGEPTVPMQSRQTQDARDAAAALRTRKSQLARELTANMVTAEQVKAWTQRARLLIGEVSTSRDFAEEIVEAKRMLTPERRDALQGDREALKRYDAVRDMIAIAEQGMAAVRSKQAEANRLLDKVERRTSAMSLAEREAMVDELAGALDEAERAYVAAKRIADWRAANDYKVIKAHKKRSDMLDFLAAEGYQQGSFLWSSNGLKDLAAKARRFIRRALQDRMIDMRDVQDEIERQMGRALDDSQNVYRLENLMHGKTADRIEAFRLKLVEPLKDAVKATGMSQDAVDKYLWAKHAKERNAKIRAIRPGVEDGSGMTDEAADTQLASYTPEQLALLERVSARVEVIRRASLKTLVESGQLTPEAAEAIQSSYSHYVPLRGKDGEGEERVGGRGTGQGISAGSPGVQRALGRKTPPKNILAELVGDGERAIVQAGKAEVGRALLRLVLSYPNPDLWSVEPVVLEPKFSEATGEVYLSIGTPDDAETIIVKHNGKPYKVQIKHPRLVEALKNTGVTGTEFVVRYIGWVNRWLSAVFTRFNPGFVPINLARDLLQGASGLYAELGPKSAAIVMSNWRAAFAASYADSRGRRGDSSRPDAEKDMRDWAREFAEQGGKTGYTSMEDADTLQQQIEDSMLPIADVVRKHKGNPIPVLAQVFERSEALQWVEDVNDGVENALRIAAYAHLRKDKGWSKDKAATYAKEMTVNFNRKGTAGSVINSLYLFYNAAVQGSRRTLMLMNNPKVKTILGGLAAGQFFFAMALGMQTFGEDDEETLWEKIPDHAKRRGFIIPTGFDEDGTARYISIPMPFGFNVLPATGGYLANYLSPNWRGRMGDSPAKHGTDFMAYFSSTLIDAVSPVPVGEEGWFQPTIMRMYTNLERNRDDLGRRIRPSEDFSRFDMPRAGMYTPGTPESLVLIAKGLNRLGGGDDLTPPKLFPSFTDVSPNDLEYLLGQFTGGPGTILLQSTRAATREIAIGDMAAFDIPVVRAVVGGVRPEQRAAARFYDNKDSFERGIERMQRAFAEGGEEEMRRVQAELGPAFAGIDPKVRKRTTENGQAGEVFVNAAGQPELEPLDGSVLRAYRDADRELKEISASMRQVFNNRELGPVERQRQLVELQRLREQKVAEFNRLMSRANVARSGG